ncbi:MAG TPA: thioredoxin domain-containing protein [Devosia sp.]|nr:thioredoxin domain-containing protein [Devosia sp.]
MANRRNILIGSGVVAVAAIAGGAWYFTRPADPLSTPVEGATGGNAEGTVQTTALMSPAGVRDKVLGSPDAKVTVIEYASPTCPHCAAFANDVRPAFEAKYVDSGKVKFIVRPFTRNNVDAAIFLLAEAAADAANGTPAAPAASTSSEATAAAAPAGYSEAAVAAYHNVINTYFKTQNTWAVASDSYTALLNIATQLGFSKETFDATLKDSKAVAPLEAARDQALNEFGLTGTPTFYINGKALSGEKTLEALSAEIDPLL